MIRRGTIDDIDALIEMASPFLNYSKYSEFTEIDPDEIAFSLCNILDNGVIFVAEIDGKVVGAIVGMMSQFWFSRKTKLAAELAWWVKAEHRKGTVGIRLLTTFEEWAKENGATVVSLSDLKVADIYPAGELYEKLGYVATERAHVKGV